MTQEQQVVLDTAKPYGLVYGELDNGCAPAYEQNGRFFGLDLREVTPPSAAEVEAEKLARAIADKSTFERAVQQAVEAKLKAVGLKPDGTPIVDASQARRHE